MISIKKRVKFIEKIENKIFFFFKKRRKFKCSFLNSKFNDEIKNILGREKIRWIPSKKRYYYYIIE